MSDYMKEAERLLAAVEAKAFQLARGVCSFDESREARVALLAHIQRGAVPESLDPEFLIGYLEEREDWRGREFLIERIRQAAAPDQFRDAAKMMAEPAEVPDKWEYYYRDSDCTAADSGDPDCICWHDEGRGPYNNARHDDEDTFLEWRRVNAPAPSEVQCSRPNVSCAAPDCGPECRHKQPAPAEVPEPEPADVKLYAWRPSGHGEYSFYVASTSEEAAREAVQAEVDDLRKIGLGYETHGWEADYYTLECVGLNEVMTNDND